MVTLLPGAVGVDSPDVDDIELPPDRWGAWLQIETDRLAGWPTPSHILRHAIGLPTAPTWRFWWDRDHPGGPLTHRADVVPVAGGGETLLSACGYSAPWPGYGAGVAPVDHVPVRDPRRTYCLHCTATVPVPWPATAAGRRSLTARNVIGGPGSTRPQPTPRSTHARAE